MALAAMKGERTLGELAQQYDIHPNQVTDWKRQLLERAVQVFDGPKPEPELDRKELHAKIGQLTLENDFFRRRAHQGGTTKRKTMIDRTHELSISAQCRILELPRSTAYYQPVPESAGNLVLMRRIDELPLEFPFAGARMVRDLLRQESIRAGRRRIAGLMIKMGIEAIYRKPNTSKKVSGSYLYPCLLRNLTIDRPNQVWATGITYIPMRRGFVYWVAVVDWFSRKVLNWRVSNTLTTDFCLDAVRRSPGIE